MTRTKRLKNRTQIYFVLIWLSIVSNVFAVEPSWMGITKLDGNPTGIIRDIVAVDENIFVGAENGFFHLVGRKVAHYSDENSPLGNGYISDLDHDNGNVYISEYGSGAYVYSINSGDFIELNVPSELAKSFWSVKSFDSIIVLSAVSKIVVLNKESGLISIIDKLSSDYKMREIYSIESHKNKPVVSEANHLIFLTPNGVKDRVRTRTNHYPKLSKITYVRSFDEQLYIGGPEGVYRELTSGKDFLPIEIETERRRDVESILKDSKERLWVAAGGIFYLNKDQKILQQLDSGLPRYGYEQVRAVQAIEELESGEILVASTQLGLTDINAGSVSINYLHETDFPFRNDVYSATPIGKNKYLAKTAQRWLLLDAETGRLSKLAGIPFENEPIPGPNNQIFSAENCQHYSMVNEKLLSLTPVSDPGNYCPFIEPIYYSKGQNQYFYFQKPTHAGFVSIINNTLTHYVNAPKTIHQVLISDDDALVVLDKNNRLYIEEDHGVWVKQEIQELQGVFVYCMYQGSALNEVYFCTSGQGIKRYNLQSGKLSDAFPQHDIPKFVRDGYFDSQGNHWLATNIGFTVVNNASMFVFDSSDGIIDSDFNYRGIIPLNTEQVLLIGDQLGYVIDTKQLASYVDTRRQYASTVSILSSNIRTNEGVQTRLVPLAEPNVFAANTEEINFEFASSNFIYSHAHNLEYRLDGFNNEWHPLSNNMGTVAYSGLGHGDFGFEVRVIDRKSDALQPVRRYSFSIQKPFWLTPTALLFYLLLLIVIVWFSSVSIRRYTARKSRVLASIIQKKQSSLLEKNHALSELIKKKDNMFKSLAYEMRTPAMLVIDPVKQLRQGHVTGAMRTTLDTIYHNASKLRSIAEQMIVVERIHYVCEQEQHAYNLDKTIKYIVETVRPNALAKAIAMTTRCTVESEVLLVRDSLELMLSNLLNSSINTIVEKGKIHIEVTLAEQRLTISVVDNSNGGTLRTLDLSTLESTIGPDFSPDDTNRSNLYLVQELAIANDGWLEMDVDESTGTSVLISLPYIPCQSESNNPLSQADMLPLQVKEQTSSYTSNPLPVVLIVGSNIDASNYLISILSERFNCYEVQSGSKALDVVSILKPEILITDFKMVEMTGIELTQKIRAMPSFSDLPIMVLTSQSDHQAKIECFKAKVNDYLVKPVERDELILRIENNLAFAMLSKHAQSANTSLEQSEKNTYVKDILPACKTEKDRQFVIKFLDVIDGNFHNEGFSRRDAAGLLAMSERQLNRTLAKLLPDNFALFLKKYRLEKSLNMLAQGKSITLVAMDVGFGSASYFSRCFKQEYQCLPTQMSFTNNETSVASK